LGTISSDQSAAVLALLSKSERTAPETIRYNGYLRDMLLDLLKAPPPGVRDDVKELSRRVGLAA
jgi:hypothetical protein